MIRFAWLRFRTQAAVPFSALASTTPGNAGPCSPIATSWAVAGTTPELIAGGSAVRASVT
jgi:hypothetical protein